MENLSKNQIITIGIILLVIVIVVGYYFISNIPNINYEELDDISETPMNTTETENIEKIEENVEIVVHIAGAVKKEGIVTVKEGARIIDAIEEAGGLNEDADLKNVNLAYIISDGQKIYIPYKNDENESYVNTENGEGVIINNENENSSNNSIININTATAEQLSNLPGIGSSIAQKIVDYRKENGKFNSIEDIKNVSGIGDSKYNSIKDYICIK